MKFYYETENPWVIVAIIVILLFIIAGLMYWASTYSWQSMLITMIAVKLINAITYKDKKLF